MKMLAHRAVLMAASTSLGLASGAYAATPGQFREITGAEVSSSFVPRALDNAVQTVMVILQGDPVAKAQQRAGRKLSDGERDAIITARRSEHDALAPEIRRHGGQVVGHLHSALNGVKVQIARNNLDRLRMMPGVVDVVPVGTYQRNNTVSVPYIGSPSAWQLPAQYQGQGVKIAIVDTGIDYTHANFGGPGTVAAFNTAAASSTVAANPAWFGPGAPKVKGGIDLVGDAYNSAGSTAAARTPHPDPNPLDCGGHGSHVAGTAAGFGVKANGATFTGPYNAAAYTTGAFKIGPGVAPKADLYAVRVFGCSGSTSVVTEAIDWAVANGMDVISMSLGSNYGTAINSDTAAIANATAAGILVVAASGNAGPTPYITSAPASSDGVIAVAATDSTGFYAGASLALTGVPSPLVVQNSNGAIFANASSYPIVVLRNLDGTVSLGCGEAEYDKNRNGGIDITGKLVVTMRGTCARVFRAGAGQHYGAAAVAMVNTDNGFPTFEGTIPGGDATTNPYEPVTIPFFGVRLSDKAALSGPTGGPAPATSVATNATIANPGFGMVAGFSSAGPRIGDSALRPGVTAPGVGTTSTLVGSGTGSVTESGTSMATPHVAGVAALVKQAKPTWSTADRRAAVVQTAAPGKLTDYAPRNEGSGVVQALLAVTTEAVVRLPNDSLSFGFADLLQDFSATQQVTLHNDGAKAVQFNISVTPATGPATASVTAPSSVIVNAKSDATFPVTLNLPANSVGGTHDAATGACCLFQDVSGYIQLKPSNTRLNSNVALTVPYYLVAHSRSNLTVDATSVPTDGGTVNLTVSNAGGALAGTPDFYALGQQSPAFGVTQADSRAIGVQSNVLSASDRLLVFAINTHNRISNPTSYVEWEIYVDPTGLETNPYNSRYLLVVVNGTAVSTAANVQEKLIVVRYTRNAAGNYVSPTLLFFADAGTDNSTVLAPVKASQLGLTVANPRMNYWEQHFGTDGTYSAMPGRGQFNAFAPSLVVTGGGTVAPGGAIGAAVSVNVEWANTPALGLMVVAPDNKSGASQALLLPAGSPP